MKQFNFGLQVFSLTVLLSSNALLFHPTPASALPLFAKKYSLPCTACHEAFPKLNDFGIAFRDNGYQLGTERDTPQENPVVSPLSLRTTPIFSVESQSAVPTDQSNSDSVSTGSFNLTGLDILTAGVLAKNVSYELVITPFLDSNVDLESAWIRFSNILDSSWLNIKFGKHELDIPLSEKRTFGLTGGGGSYLVNHYHPGGSANSNGFELGANQYGLELMGHDKGSRIRYVIDINNGSNPASNQEEGKQPNIYTHLSVNFNQELANERVGLLADFGRWPIAFKSASGIVLPGTGENTKPYSRLGGDMALNLGSSGTPLISIIVQYLYGMDDGNLIGQSIIPDTALTCPTLPTHCGNPFAGSTGGTQEAIFHGGTLEINWMPSLHSLIFGHYDRVVNLQQPDPGMPTDYNDQSSLALGFRYYIQISQTNLVALHAEWSQSTSQKTNLVTGEDQVTTAYLAGVDYAF